MLHGDGVHEPLEGKVDLVYIDPPFAVQSDFKINVEIENGVSDEKLPTLIEQLAYTDTWKNGLDSYLSMMRDRLELLKALLAPTGSIYVHCDWHAGHYLKVLMDEVFGYENFVNEVVWRRAFGHSDSGKCGNIHDLILLYGKGNPRTWNRVLHAPNREYIETFFDGFDEKRGERYQRISLSASGLSGGGYDYEYKGVRALWRCPKSTLEQHDKDGRLHWPKQGVPRLKRFESEYEGTPLQDLWLDVNKIHNQSGELIGFPTQKPVALLQRIIAASSNPGDLVLDCFAGSGTTAIAAEAMKETDGKPAPRRWIAIDCGKFAVHITRKRLIEASARPFAVENIGFYARHGEWKDVWQANPSAKRYRDAMVEIYGGATVDGFTYLHGKKGNRWVHVGALNAPVADAQVEAIVKEAAATDTRAVDILSADIPIDWNKSDTEAKYGVTVSAKIIPQAAIEAVRARLKRRAARDPDAQGLADDTTGAPGGLHFFSPPDIEIRVTPNKTGDSVTVVLTRLTLDLDDCLSTQDPKKRAEIKSKITDWRALIDYWAVDWDYNGDFFRNDWQSFRTRKQKEIATQAAHDYPAGGANPARRVAVKVTDIFGNDGLKVVHVSG